MNQKQQILRTLQARIDRFIELTLKDVSVELLEAFDKNFEREAFFNERWARRKYNDDRSRGLLVRTGTLRRSLRAEVTKKDSVRFFTDVPYAAIHNEGGTITVTRKMKKYFWWRYLTITGSKGNPAKGYDPISTRFRRKKDGTFRNDKRNRALTAEAAFYKAMALKPAGGKVVIPKRQFIGNHPDVERLLREIALENMKLIMN